MANGGGGAPGASGSDDEGGVGAAVAGAAGEPGGDGEAGAAGMTSEPDPAVSFTTYEAEVLKLLGTKANVYEDPSASGARGVAYLEGLGDGISLQGGSRAGSTLMIRYAATEDGHLSVYVNGRKRGFIHFVATGAASRTYADAYLPIEIPENAWVTLQRDVTDASASIDYIGIGPVSVDHTYQAEDALLLAPASVVQDGWSFGGPGWSVGFLGEGGGIRLEGVPSGSGLVLRHAGFESGSMSVYVNGAKRGTLGIFAQPRYEDALSSFMTDIPDQATVDIRRDAGDVPANLDWVQIMAPTSLRAQPLASEGPAHALLEPKTGIIHGVGDSPDRFSAYWDALGVGRRPALFMSYASIMGDPGGDIDAQRQALNAYPEFVIPVVMLSHSDDVTDAAIEDLIAGLTRLARPAYLAYGYGFDVNGYVPETYRNAFRRVTRRLREAGLLVATVWNPTKDGSEGATSAFYPGDDVVDWWAMPQLDVASFSDPGWIGFAERASAHRKPLMVTQAAPKDIGATQGLTSFSLWFKPFFGFIEQHQVKAFCYLNIIFGSGPDQKDARLESDGVVLGNYRAEMLRPVYVHASLEAEFLAKFGLTGPARP